MFNSSQVLIFTEYRGLSVADLTSLRRQLREKGVEYHIAKNTLTELAAKRAGIDQMSEMLGGPLAIAFVRDDISGATKVLNDFVRSSKVLVIRGGIAGRSVLSAEQVSDLTKMLTKEQYIAQVLGTMQAPIRNFVTVLSGTLRGIMNVMQARIDQMKEQGGDSEVDGATESTESEAAMSTVTTGTDTDGADSEGETAIEASSPISDATGESAETTEASEASETSDSTEAEATPEAENVPE